MVGRNDGGPLTHRVVRGESLSSIAARYGFFELTLWELPENAALRALRKHPDVLAEGDEVAIPVLRCTSRSAVTGKCHVFRRKGIPAVYRARLLRDGVAIANADFMLTIDGHEPRTGMTDGDGRLEVFIPPGGRAGQLEIPAAELRVRVRFGLLDPIDSLLGVQQRLQNLGYYRGVLDGAVNDAIRAALAAFQKTAGLDPSGACDDATRAALEKAHEPRLS